MNEESNLIKIEFIYLPAINYAMQQNRVSLIRKFTIENKSDEAFQNIKVSLSTDPDFADNITSSIDSISPGEIIRIDSLRFNLSSAYFAQLTERSVASIKIKITSNEQILSEENYPIEVLAFDQWGGISVLPEMLSSFITPNHPALVPIIQRASSILGQWTGNPSLDSYQSANPDRPWKQMAAVYAAICELNITYSTLPASFEEYGQRIRMVDAVVSQKLGNCIDLSLLYAACLEQIGLHPFIIITHGHAFTGAWLVSETFPDSIVDDVSLLTKRIADGMNEIALVEATCMCNGHQTDFITAVKAANNKLIQPNDFVLALDVKRSRFAGIKPLPQRILNGQHWEIKESEASSINMENITPEKLNRYDLSNINRNIEVTKQLLWERKLLDLSLRNSLLNLSIKRTSLQLISTDLDKIEDALSDGAEFQIMPRPTDWDNPLYDSKIQKKVEESDPIIDLIRSELKQNRLRSYLNEVDLNKTLLNLYKSSRLSIEENGANTLYLALGLLKWYETPESEQPRHAPILLLPIEIVRKSAAKGYIIRTREEDTILNITLIEMLRQNFGVTISGLDPLPTDEKGLDVNLIFTIVRNSIKDQKKWDIEEQAILGIFSFNKFIMWNDIHNNSEKLKSNEIVSSLINGKIEWNVDHEMADASDLEKTLSPTDIILPVSADSSQIEAIYEAVNDKSYILHGPPGTGKSQTITNIIANALYKGKRVLFVAEKMAALSVVQSRLEAIGLAPFCLELHSNKSKKSAVIAQLKRTTEVTKGNSPEGFSQEADRLSKLRSELITYVDVLHQKYSFGVSLYDSIVKYLAIENDTTFKFPQSIFDNLTAAKIQEWQDAVESMVNVARTCGHPHQHPLERIKISTYSANKKEEIENILKQYSELLLRLLDAINSLTPLFGDKIKTCNINDVQLQLDIVDQIFKTPELTPNLLTRPRLTDLLSEYSEIAKHGKKRDSIKSEICSQYKEEVLSIDAKQLLSEWNENSEKWFVGKYFGQRKVKKQLKNYLISGDIEDNEVDSLLNKIISYNEENNYINQHNSELDLLFGKYGKAGLEDWNTIDTIIEQTTTLNSLILQYSKDISEATAIKELFARQLTEGVNSFKEIYQDIYTQTQSLVKDLKNSDDKISTELGIDKETLHPQSEQWIEETIAQTNLWIANIDKLKDWYQWTVAADQLKELGIGFAAEAYSEGNLPTDAFLDIFDKSLYRGCTEYILADHPEMELFRGELFNETILKYKKLIADFEELTRKELQARLASNIPSFTQEAAQNSEVGILQKNIRNNGRALSLRRLFDQIPTLLPRMCPCMLMSPISVAQYIDPEADKFDLVVFDEASQMPTYEAVGAIARGKNVIVVGDPKQMPPTSFFATNVVDEDNMEIEDLESILDDCLALSMPSKYLLWHYRSKHESLIAFSNSEYYDNKLLTFPSPDNIESKVKLVRIEGSYDKGKTRQNKTEAQAVVSEIERRLADPLLCQKSIGVVTFSSVQQLLIEELLSDLFVLRPDLETIATEREEPLFVKNLENVQGDERDIILFSVGYGPDANGRVSMNFGPLNRMGGERRLNVAVSRARYEMIIFSTLSADQIDLNKTSAMGVSGLKRFLEYAEKGEPIVSDISQTNIGIKSSIESLVAKELRKLGYTVHTDIGYSGYKIDIGIVDTQNPRKYLLGIICDGANYVETKTVRDREIVQNSVLNLLGWNILRVWTMDWWENSQKIIDKIKATIETIKQNKTLIADQSPMPEPPSLEKKNFESRLNSIPQMPPSINENIETLTHEVGSKDINIENQYTTAQLASVDLLTDSFLYPENKEMIKDQIKLIVETEAPISKALLCKKILGAWGIARLGQRLDAHLETLFSSLPYYRVNHEDLTFFWKDEEQYNNYNSHRIHSERDAVDLPPEEVANGIREILEQQISIPLKDMIRITAQHFGFARSGTNVEASVLRGLKVAVSKGWAKINNDRVVII